MNLIIVVLVSLALLQMLNGGLKNLEINTFKWLFILSFLGYRTFSIVGGLGIHPLEVILWTYLIMVKSSAKVPVFFYIFLFFAIFIGLLNQVDFLRFAKEFKSLLLIIPSFKLASNYLLKNIGLNKILGYLLLGLSLAAFIGVLEYYSPGLANLVPGMQNTAVADDLLDFKRAKFSHWGAPTVGHALIFSIPITLKFIFEDYGKYWVNISLLFINLTAIYITGNRADWIALIPIIMIMFMLYNSRLHETKYIYRKAPLVLLIGSIYFATGEGFYKRFESGLIAILGTANKEDDSSGYVRANRVEDAWNSILENPLGVGLGKTGWVHSDFLQITQAMGWIPGLMAIVFFINILFKGYVKLSILKKTPYTYTDMLFLISCNIAVVFQFTVNGIYSVPQTGVYYFVFAGLLYFYSKNNLHNPV